MRLTQAILFVADLEQMIAFYREVIGMTLVEETRTAQWAEFKGHGGLGLALHALPADASVLPSPVPRETQSCKLVLAVESLAAERSRLAACGVTILDRTWGGWDIADPEGNVLGITKRG